MADHLSQLQALLLEEHSKGQRDVIVQYIHQHPIAFQDLMALVASGENQVAQRAAWPMGVICEQQPEWILPYLPGLLEKMESQSVHPAVKRNFIRTMQHLQIPYELQGRVLDFCYSNLLNGAEPAAIRVFAMTVIFNISQSYPELQHELKEAIEAGLENGSAGFRNRGKKILVAMERGKSTY